MFYPEYEDVKECCRKTGKAFTEIMKSVYASADMIYKH